MGDEVRIKENGAIGRIVAVEVEPAKQAARGNGCFAVMLDDGCWYGHREIA